MTESNAKLHTPAARAPVSPTQWLRAATRGARMRSKQVARYSTVTDFARLRGWSASLPMMTAV